MFELLLTGLFSIFVYWEWGLKFQLALSLKKTIKKETRYAVGTLL